MKIFRKKERPDVLEIIQEKWTTSFGLFHKNRFEEEDTDDYSSSVSGGKFSLQLKKKNVFVWADDELYRYDDFLITANIGAGSDEGYSSSGFMFRKTDDTSYYYFLVSNRGFFRFDIVFNGIPSPIIGWTALEDFSSDSFSLQILAEGESFRFYLDNSLVCEAADDRLSAGSVAFIAQNYDEKDSFTWNLRKFQIESRHKELGKHAARLAAKQMSAEAYIREAESLMTLGRYTHAAVELKKALALQPGDSGAVLMTADCLVNLGLYEEAERYFLMIPEESRESGALMSMAGMYYISNNLLKTRDLIKDSISRLENNPAAWNLLGNAEYALGNSEAAADAYGRAFSLDDSFALYSVNEGRALEKSGRMEPALAAYSKASSIFYRDGDYESLFEMLPLMESIDSSSIATEELRGKILFAQELFDEAEKVLDEVIKKKSTDSAVFYLNALVKYRNGDKTKALKLVNKALKIEPEYYLYHLRKAEWLFPEGKYTKALERALGLAPADPWVLNMSGLAAMQNQDFNEALRCFSAASELLPDEDEIMVNYSEALYNTGDSEKAFEVISEDNFLFLNQRGHLYVKSGDYQASAGAYERALRIQPDNTDVMLNLASVCFEADMFSRSEELLVRVLNTSPSADAYNLMGNLTSLKGESARAEESYKAALKLQPDSSGIICNLASFYIAKDRYHEADLLLSGISDSELGERGIKLKKTVFRYIMSVHNCSVCEREWIVPKKIETPGALKLVGEPPDHMPAGQCPVCGRIYCIGCAKENLVEGRFFCTECSTAIKLSADWMRYLYNSDMLDK